MDLSLNWLYRTWYLVWLIVSWLLISISWLVVQQAKSLLGTDWTITVLTSPLLTPHTEISACCHRFKNVSTSENYIPVWMALHVLFLMNFWSRYNIIYISIETSQIRDLTFVKTDQTAGWILIVLKYFYSSAWLVGGGWWWWWRVRTRWFEFNGPVTVVATFLMINNPW